MAVIGAPRKAKPALFILISVITTCHGIDYSWLPPASHCDSTHPAHPNQAIAPALPKLPDQYSMIVESNMEQRRWTTQVEEHYDWPNKRASVALTFNGTTTTSVYNYESNERYDIYPNATCVTRPAEVDFLGLFSMDRQHRPAMATINEAFHFGIGFNQTYVGNATVRGIKAHHWTSCQEWTSIGARFQLDFYFSDPNFLTAQGKSMIPLRAVLNGSAQSIDMGRNPLNGRRHTFYHMYEFVSFKSGPFVNDEVFQIPPGVVCQGRSDNKPMPQLPDRFEMNMEIVLSKPMHPRNTFFLYDYKHYLLESSMRELIPKGYGKLGPHGRKPGARGGRSDTNSRSMDNLTEEDMTILSFSRVQDFMSGVEYIVDRINMTCKASKMKGKNQFLTMAHGQNLLNLGDENGVAREFTYQGQTYLRRMLVDVWAAEYNGLTQEVYFMAERDEGMRGSSGGTSERRQRPSPDASSGKSTLGPINHLPYPVLVGMYTKNRTAVGSRPPNMSSLFREVFTPDAMQWAGIAGPPTTPETTQQQHPSDMSTGDQISMGLQMERILERSLAEKLIHIYNYKPIHTEMTNFQVSLCYGATETSQVMLYVDATYETDVLTHYAAFINSLRDSIATNVGVSILQVSNMVATSLNTKDADGAFIRFSLLGAAPVSGARQVGLDEAKKRLERAIKNGISFKVDYASAPKSFMVNKKIFTMDYDKYDFSQLKDGSDSIRDGGIRAATDGGSSGDSGKYTSGAVAGIAIATLLLGAIVAVGVMYVFYKRKHPEESIIPYQMTS